MVKKDLRTDTSSMPFNDRTLLVQFAYIDNQVIFSILASLFCATVLFIGLHDAHTNLVLLNGWYVSFWCISLFQSVVIYFFSQVKKPQEYLHIRRFLFYLCIFLGAAAWGIVGIIFFPYASEEQKMLMILILAGVTAGVVPALSVIFSGVVLYLLLALVPYILAIQIVIQRPVFMLFNATLVAYLCYLILLSYKTHKVIYKIISLQISNEKLFHKLASANRKLSEMATQDPLTQINNSRFFYASFMDAIERAKTNKEMVALLYIDIDKFKTINDNFGHQVGDEALLGVVKAIKSTLRRSDHVFRVGGDEFAVVIEHAHKKQDINFIAEKICNTMNMPIVVDEHILQITISMGISIYPDDGEDVELLEKVADKAMYQVKRSNKNFSGYSRLEVPPENL